ncbi:hypothetical protein MTP99_014660 [Tenebrio molitor]|nr:hypothetical protein MTP99_014660 [Tenebrio molitor]
MDILWGLIVIAAIYLWILFMDRFFKSCSHYGYIQFLKGTGLEIRFFQFSWTTTAFNKLLLKWGNETTWYKCLSTLKTNKPAFCIEGDVIHNLDESVHLKHLENGVTVETAFWSCLRMRACLEEL